MNSSTGSRAHICTVQVEDYFQAGVFGSLIPYEHWQRFDTRIRRNTEAALELLAAYESSASFFASGWLGEQHPEILRLIVEHGHEVACQGFYQQGVRELSPRAFREDLRRSRAAIEQATGKAVHGFRIGKSWLGEDDEWVLETLADEGFAYDSSILPRGRAYPENPDWFYPHERNTPSGTVFEIPVSASVFAGFALPFSGGNYLRQLPPWLVRAAHARWAANSQAPLVSYFHIWELDIEQPGIHGVSWLQRIRHYRNLAAMPERIARLLKGNRSCAIARWLDLPSTPVASAVPGQPAVLSTVEVDEPAQPLTRLTVVIPCFNESEALRYLANTLDSFIEHARAVLQVRFILVDDGSTDDTWELMQAVFKQRQDCKLIKHADNAGIAAAILTGVRAAEDEIVAVLDADCSFDPRQLTRMVPLLRDGVSAVCGSPYFGDGTSVPAWRRALSLGAAGLYRFVLHHKFASYTSCFRVYRKQAVESMQLYNRRYCGVTEILARLDLAGAVLVESRAELNTRVLGVSKINTLKTTLDHLQLIARIAAQRWFGQPLPQGLAHAKLEESAEMKL